MRQMRMSTRDVWTTIYWTIQHRVRAAREGRFRVRCRWLEQQVDFQGCRLRLGARMPQPGPAAPEAEQEKCYAMPSLSWEAVERTLL